MCMGKFCKSFNVIDIHHRICRCFDVDCLCIFPDVTLNFSFIAIYFGDLKTVFLTDMVKQTDRSTVEICVYDQMIPRFK